MFGLNATAGAIAVHTEAFPDVYRGYLQEPRYEYVGFIHVLLKRAWFLYEIVILVGIVIAISIAITIGGTILDDHFGIPVWFGSLGTFVLIVLLTYYGRRRDRSNQRRLGHHGRCRTDTARLCTDVRLLYCRFLSCRF